MADTNWDSTLGSSTSGGTWISNTSVWNGARGKDTRALANGDYCTFLLSKAGTGYIYYGLDDDTGLADEIPTYAIEFDYSIQGTITFLYNGSNVGSASAPSETDEIKFTISNSSGVVTVMKNGAFLFAYPTATTVPLYQSVIGVGYAKVVDCTNYSSVVNQTFTASFFPDNRVTEGTINQTFTASFFPDNRVQETSVSATNNIFRWWFGMRGRKRYGKGHIRRIRI